jgi:Zn-dependent peptidase ImmA (M78 family)/DNA-binding XRE family transcriptional regulator
MEFNPSRLSIARRRRGHTQVGLARLLECDARAVRKWEKGDHEPTPEYVSRLARVLNFSEEFFTRADCEDLSQEIISFRKLSKTCRADRERAIAAGEMALELNGWLESHFDLPPPDVPDLRDYEGEPEAAALALRNYWGLGDKPIKHMIALLEYKGVRVFSLAEQSRHLDAYSFWKGGRPFVFLNTNKSSERSRFDAAHELAHLVLHTHGTPQGRKQEQEAQAFAGALLMPRISLLARAPRVVTVPRLIEAKHHWNVALSALAYRLREIEHISDWQYHSLCVAIQKSGYRTSEPESAPRERSQVWDKVFAALRDEGIGRRELACKLSWPIEEIDGLVFGLILSSVAGGAKVAPAPATVDRPTPLKLIK